jgi:membrane protease YdiL (CAAX protease family)
MGNEPRLGAWTALGAFVVVMLGMGLIGLPLQSMSIVRGLWLTEAIAIALPAFFVLLLAGVRPGPYLGFRPLSWKHVVIVVIVAAANQPIVSFLTWAAQHALPEKLLTEFDEKQRMLDYFFRRNALAMMATVTIAAPVGEEIFFRGFLLPGLRKSWGIWAAVILSGALFSAIHLDPVGFLGLMEIGILLAALRIWTGSLWGSILGHALNNGVAGFAFLQGWEDPDVAPPPPVLIAGAILCIVGAVLLVRILRRDWRATEERKPSQPASAVALALIWGGALAWSVAWLYQHRIAV